MGPPGGDESIRPSGTHSYDGIGHLFCRNIRQFADHSPLCAGPSGNRVLFLHSPYSIVFWDRVYRRGTLEGTLSAQEAALQALAQCDNVHVYYPCAEEEVICDLEQYTDPIHYSPQVNQWITEEMASSSGLAPQEIPQAVEEMRQLAWNYPYEELFALYPPQLPPET